MLKRKFQLFSPAVFQESSFSLKPKAVSTQAKLNGEVKPGVSTIPAATLDLTPLRSILFYVGVLLKELFPFPWPAGSSQPGPAALSAFCSVPGPGIFIVAKGNEVGVGEEGLGQGLERWGWGGQGTSCGRGSCNYV